MTPFEHLCNLAGIFSVEDTAKFLNIRRQTASQLWLHQIEIPYGIIVDLYNEYQSIKGMTLEEVVEFVNGDMQ